VDRAGALVVIFQVALAENAILFAGHAFNTQSL
jgi:hypothetical protein